MNDKFNISAQAKEKIREGLIERGTPDAFLRIGIRGGGCAGYYYHLEYSDDDPKDKDVVFEFEDIKIIIDKKSLTFLKGAELDWIKTLMYEGFRFNNPQVNSTCGCSMSFSI